MKNYSRLAILVAQLCGALLWEQAVFHNQNPAKIWLLILVFVVFFGSLGYLWIKSCPYSCDEGVKFGAESTHPGISQGSPHPTSEGMTCDGPRDGTYDRQDDILGIQESSAFHAQLGNELSEQLSSAHTELGNTQAILNDAIVKLVSNFIAISDGVRELSEHTNSFSRQLHDLTDNVGVPAIAIERAASETGGLSAVKKSNDQIGKIMEDLYAFKEKVTKNAVDLNMISTNVEQNVLVVISTLQFQDMSSQLIEHARLRMNALQKVADEMGKVSSSNNQPSRKEYLKRIAEYNRLLDKYVTSLNRQKANPVAQKDFVTGDIELF